MVKATECFEALTSRLVSGALDIHSLRGTRRGDLKAGRYYGRK